MTAAPAQPSGGPTRRPARTVAEVRDRLRHAILSGDLPPTTPLSIVALAQSYGVSRTPLREAIRMLEEEGLVVFEGNRRPRVAIMSADDMEAVYAQRILLTALGTYLTVPGLTDADLQDMHAHYVELIDAAECDDLRRWRIADRAFHAAHTVHASAPLREEMLRLRTKSEYFQTIWAQNCPHKHPSSREDHRRILESCQAGDAVTAAQATATHLGRVALSIMTHIAPTREPATIRAALALSIPPLAGPSVLRSASRKAQAR